MGPFILRMIIWFVSLHLISGQDWEVTTKMVVFSILISVSDNIIGSL